MFRTIGIFLVINCICVFSTSKQRPLKVYVCQWSKNALPIYYLKGDTTEPLYRIEKEIVDNSLELVDERTETVVARSTGLTFKILDTKNGNQTWIGGRIEPHFRVIGYKLTIVWNGITITMTGRKIRTFYDQKKQMLARAVFSYTKPTYELEIWSDRIPETLYFIAFISHARMGASK